MGRDRRWGSLYDIYYGLTIGLVIVIVSGWIIMFIAEGFSPDFWDIIYLGLAGLVIPIIFWIVFYFRFVYWKKAEGFFRDFAGKNNFDYKKQDITKKFNGFFGELKGLVDGVPFRALHYAGWFYYAYPGICFEATANKTVKSTAVVKYLPLRLRIFGDLEKTRFPNSFTLLRKPVRVPRTQIRLTEHKDSSKLIAMSGDKNEFKKIFTDSVLEKIVKTKAETLVYKDKVYCSKFGHLKFKDDLKNLTDLAIEITKNVNNL